MLNKLTLRNRLTLVTVLVLVLLCIGISIFALYNAENAMFVQFRDFQDRHLPLNGPGPGAPVAPPPNAIEFQALIKQAQRDFIIGIVLMMLFFIVLGSAIMYFFASRVLKPVTDLSEKIANINALNLDEKLIVSQSNDEISSLTRSFNDMLEKLSYNFNLQKRFSQSAAHELKTPLACILANIEVLELDEHPSINEYKDVVHVTKKSTLQLIKLVEDLMHSNVAQSHSCEVIELHDLLKNVLSVHQYFIDDKKLKVNLNGNLRINGDVVLFERLFGNIISNAIRYNVHGGSIDISIIEDAIHIRDSGIGMESLHIEKIFEPFYCRDKALSRDLGGTGLGLSIVKDVLSQYALSYEIDSVLGEYTLFTIYLKNVVC